MEPSDKRFHFLDWSDISEEDQSFIENVLFGPEQARKVPVQNQCINSDPSQEDWIIPPYRDTNEPTPHQEPLRPNGLDVKQVPIPEEHEEVLTRPLAPPPGAPQMFTPTSLPHQQPPFQMFPMVQPHNVYVSTVTANVSLHSPYVAPMPQPPAHIYSPEDPNTRNRRPRPKDKKVMQVPPPPPQAHYMPTNEVLSPPIENHAPPYHQFMPPPVQHYYIHPQGAVYAMQPSMYAPQIFQYNHTPPLVYPSNAIPSNEEYQENYQPQQEMIVNNIPPPECETYEPQPTPPLPPSTPPPPLQQQQQQQQHHQEQQHPQQPEETQPFEIKEEITNSEIKTENNINVDINNCEDNNESVNVSEPNILVNEPMISEHLCYHTEVVLKLPPKKKTKEKSEERTVSVSSPPPHEVPIPNNTRQGSVEKTWASLFNSSAPPPSGRPLARVPPFQDTPNSKVSSGKIKKAPKMVSLTGKTIDDPRLERLGLFLNDYELEHKAVNLQPRGLTNRSNWCYINSILQALIACPPFYNLMKAIASMIRVSNQTPIITALVDFVNEFDTLPPNARVTKREKSARNKEDSGPVEIVPGAAFEPSGVYKILDKVRGDNSFNVEGRQEDAEEFLSCLLNGINDEMVEVMKLIDAPVKPTATPTQPPSNTLNNHLTNGETHHGEVEDDEWNVMGPKNKSSVTRRGVYSKTPVSDIFRGQLRSRILRAGDQTTDSVQPFFTLQLDIEKANSVKDALELLVGKDQLEGVTCTKTHQEVEAWTQVTLEDLPNVLILHLKCFDYKLDGCSKIMKTVDFPVDLKVDPKLMSMNKTKYTGKQKQYKLFAVVYHDGKEATKGHYITDAYHVGYGCWVRYDDGLVKSVPELHVLKPKAPRVPYLLYYRRGDTIGTQNKT